MRADGARLRVGTRKLHNYLGLYFLLFLWLFAGSGLVLNHSKWGVAQFWKARHESTVERAIRPPAPGGDVATARDLMGQLAIVGEIGEIKRDAAGRFDFQVVKPGRVYRVEARPDSARARVTTIRLDAWGALDAMHKFTGVSLDDPSRARDWAVTRLWSVAMDALSLGLVALVASGLYLWLRFPDKRRAGLVALAAGVASCAFFLSGLGTRLG